MRRQLTLYYPGQLVCCTANFVPRWHNPWVFDGYMPDGTVRLLSYPGKTGVWYCGLDEIAEWPGQMN